MEKRIKKENLHKNLKFSNFLTRKFKQENPKLESLIFDTCLFKIWCRLQIFKLNQVEIVVVFIRLLNKRHRIFFFLFLSFFPLFDEESLMWVQLTIKKHSWIERREKKKNFFNYLAIEIRNWILYPAPFSILHFPLNFYLYKFSLLYIIKEKLLRSEWKHFFAIFFWYLNLVFEIYMKNRVGKHSEYLLLNIKLAFNWMNFYVLL